MSRQKKKPSAKNFKQYDEVATTFMAGVDDDDDDNDDDEAGAPVPKEKRKREKKDKTEKKTKSSKKAIIFWFPYFVSPCVLFMFSFEVLRRFNVKTNFYLLVSPTLQDTGGKKTKGGKRRADGMDVESSSSSLSFTTLCYIFWFFCLN